MVCDDAHGVALFGVRLVVAVCELRDEVNDGPQQVGLVVVRRVLQNGGHAFESGSGVNRGFGERREVARRVAVVLHEDEVPDFDRGAAVAVHVFGAVELGVVRIFAAVIVNLAARAAGARVAHLPEVVLRAEA